MRNKIHIDTYGCTANKNDSQIMAGLLKNSGFKLTSFNEADYIIINSCGVKFSTEEKIMYKIEKLSKIDKKVIIAGCLTKINPKRIKKIIPDFSAMLDTKSIDKIVNIILEIEKGKNNIIESSRSPQEKPILPKILHNNTTDVIQASEGCLSACNFCGTKLARGNLKSYKPENIRNAIEQSIKKGFREIQLTSQDMSAYGRDIGTNLIELLESITRINGDFFIRIGMMNPEHVLPILDELIRVYKNEKIMKFLHVPCQSFSDKVIKEMDRNYKYRDFKKIVKKFRKEIPGMNIATDLIVGYPSETEKDFNLTLKRLKEIKPEVLNISKFSKRPGTKAAELKQLSSKEIKRRSLELTKEYKKIKN